MKNIMTYLAPGQDLGRMGNSGFLQVFCSCEEMAANIKTQSKGTLSHCEGEQALAQVDQGGVEPWRALSPALKTLKIRT